MNTLFHNKVIHIYLCECLTCTLPTWIPLACTPFPEATVPEILQSASQVCYILWKKAQGWQTLWLASTSRIVYHPPPAVSMQGRKQVGLDYMYLFDGSLAISLGRKHVNKHRKYCAYTDQLYSTFPSGQLPQRTQCTTFIYHWKKLYYLSTWPCRRLLN